MSSEALEPPFDREQILGRVKVAERGETTLYERALLAEVARLEEADGHLAARESAEAALAVAREREQRLHEAVATALASLATGPLKDGYAYSVLDAALVDEPAAATPRLLTVLAHAADALADAAEPGGASGTYREAEAELRQLIATLAEPGGGDRAGGGIRHTPVPPTPGSASAAADKPGETPA